jgi:hypothetical protein
VTNPKNATTGRDGRFYTFRGERYWSVTTIINGGIPKPALINWAKKFTAEYACDNIKKLNALLEPEDGTVDRDGAVEWLKGAAYRDRDKKADIGTFIHGATEAYVLGKPFPEWPLPLAPRMRAFERFLSAYEPVWEATEASVYSHTERYAGTLDGIATIGRGPHKGRKLIGDTKSGKAIYPEVALQLAAYRNAEFMELPDGSEVPVPDTDGAFALHLPETGDYDAFLVETGEEVYRTFLYCREVFRWMNEISKGVLGPLVTEPVDEEQSVLFTPSMAGLKP